MVLTSTPTSHRGAPNENVVHSGAPSGVRNSRGQNSVTGVPTGANPLDHRKSISWFVIRTQPWLAG